MSHDEMKEELKNKVKILFINVVAVMAIVGFLFAALFVYKHYALWSAKITGEAQVIKQEMLGKAILSRSEHERMARVEQAKAELLAADMTAEAIEIVGKAAEKYPSYRNQEFILGFTEALKNGNINQIVYVPTEGMIPITEAGKR